MLARPCHRAGPHGQPALPGCLVPDKGPVALDGADQLGQCIAEALLPRPHALERTEGLPDAVREQRPHVLLHPRHGSRRVVQVLQLDKGIEVLTAMIIIQPLTHPRTVGMCHGPNPGGPIAHRQRGLRRVARSLPPLAVLGGAVDDALGPARSGPPPCTALASALLGLQRRHGLRNLPGHMSPLHEDSPCGAGDTMEVGRWQDALNQTFAPLQEHCRLAYPLQSPGSTADSRVE
jgi:hypothetical protein